MAAGLILFSVGVILNVEYQEIEARKRIREVQRQWALENQELAASQRAQRMTLETIAGWRSFGGFETADISRQVQARAANAAKKFTQLLPEDINLAFGTFGDLGSSYEELVDLAWIAHIHELEAFKEPLTVVKARVRILQRQNRERVYSSMGLGTPSP